MEQLTKDTNTNAIKCHEVSSIWKHNVPQKLKLGWINPFTFRKLCSTLRSSYRHVGINDGKTHKDATTL